MDDRKTLSMKSSSQLPSEATLRWDANKEQRCWHQEVSWKHLYQCSSATRFYFYQKMVGNLQPIRRGLLQRTIDQLYLHMNHLFRFQEPYKLECHKLFRKVAQDYRIILPNRNQRFSKSLCLMTQWEASFAVSNHDG